MNFDFTTETITPEATGAISIAGLLEMPITTGISAAGTTQGTATVITSNTAIITTVSGGQTGVQLPVPTGGLSAGLTCTVVNRTTSACNVWPSSGAEIDGLGTNNSLALSPNSSIKFQTVSSTLWYTIRPIGSILGTANGSVGAITFASSNPSAGNVNNLFINTTSNAIYYDNGTSLVQLGGGGGSGTVTSVGLSDGSTTPIYSISGTPVSVSGTLTFTLATQNANIIFAGPSSGGAAQPGFRSLVAADLTGLVVASLAGTSNQVAVSGSTGSVTLSIPSTFVTPGSLQVTTSMQVSATNTISAAGTNQGTGTVLTTDYNIVTTTGSGTGVVLPAGLAGRSVTIVNRGANALLVYPASSAAIDGLAANAALSVPVGQTYVTESISSTQWYTTDPTYAAGTAMSVAISNGVLTYTNTGVTALAGTTNEITVSGSTGSITLSIPSAFIAPGSVQVTTALQASINTAVSAAGTTQGTATALTKDYNVVTTATTAQGVVLPAGVAGRNVTVLNGTAAAIYVYPPSGAEIDGLGANNPFAVLADQNLSCVAASATQYWSTNIYPYTDMVQGTANQITVTSESPNFYEATVSLPTAVIMPGSLTITTSLALAAGSTTNLPLQFTSGTLNTTAVAGGMEFNGNNLYFSSVASRRSTLLSSYFYRTNVSTTLGTGTSCWLSSAGTPLTAGITLQASTVYVFEGEFVLATSGTTSHTEAIGFTLTTMTTNNLAWHVTRSTISTTATAPLTNIGTSSTGAVTIMTPAITTAQSVLYHIEGSVSVNAGGSFLPIITFSTSPGGTSTSAIGAWFNIYPVGPSGVTTIGTWS